MREFWSLLCLAGLWGFVFSTVGLTLRGFPARGVCVRRACLGWGGALLVCYVVWMVGMAHA